MRTISELEDAIKALRREGQKVAFVPTMGALHAGHLSLVEIARELAEIVVVSIFVNPTQFAPGEDFERYPRQEEADLAKLEGHVEIVWLPGVEDIYPDGAVRTVTAPGNVQVLCGASREGHFDGVATVVKRLLEVVQPDMAIFGEKDYQQLHMIRELVKTHALPVKIVHAPIVREEDGLAMSSRNRYLSDDARKKAPLVFTVLRQIAQAVYQGETRLGTLLDDARNRLDKAGFVLEYLELRDAETLASVSSPLHAPARIFIAVYLGNTRLIDNIEIWNTI